MATDVLSTLSTLLSGNWNAANTDSTTPQFLKITDVKEAEYDQGNTDLIILHRPRPQQKPGGIGAQVKHLYDFIDIDLRVKGTDTHFLKAKEELDRILDANIIGPASGFDILDPDGDRRDLSNTMRGIFRQMVTITFHRYAQARGS